MCWYEWCLQIVVSKGGKKGILDLFPQLLIKSSPTETHQLPLTVCSDTDLFSSASHLSTAQSKTATSLFSLLKFLWALIVSLILTLSSIFLAIYFDLLLCTFLLGTRVWLITLFGCPWSWFSAVTDLSQPEPLCRLSLHHTGTRSSIQLDRTHRGSFSFIRFEWN